MIWANISNLSFTLFYNLIYQLPYKIFTVLFLYFLSYSSIIYHDKSKNIAQINNWILLCNFLFLFFPLFRSVLISYILRLFINFLVKGIFVVESEETFVYENQGFFSLHNKRESLEQQLVEHFLKHWFDWLFTVHAKQPNKRLLWLFDPVFCTVFKPSFQGLLNWIQMSQPRQNKIMSPNLGKQVGDTTYTKIFVGGLAWETKRDSLKRYFDQFGEILEAVVITDRITGRSKGYGFVKPTYLIFHHYLFSLFDSFHSNNIFYLLFLRSPLETQILRQGLVSIPILWLMEGELIVTLQPLVPRNLIHPQQVRSFIFSFLFCF